MRRTWIRHASIFCLALVAHCGAATSARAVNVISMIADGAGYQTYEATAYYAGDPGGQRVRGGGWVGLAMSTYPLRKDSTEPEDTGQDPKVV